MVIDGVPHFGIWRRSHAAQIIYGDPAATDSVPLGFTVGFEIASVEDGETRMRKAGGQVVQENHVEPWGQRTCRFIAPSAAVCEIAETPWARRLQASVRVLGPE